MMKITKICNLERGEWDKFCTFLRENKNLKLTDLPEGISFFLQNDTLVIQKEEKIIADVKALGRKLIVVSYAVLEGDYSRVEEEQTNRINSSIAKVVYDNLRHLQGCSK